MIADFLKPLVNCSILEFVWRLSYLDIDECTSSGRNECDSNALCINIEGSYVCRCLKGFKGDGKTCTGDDDFLRSRNVWREHIQLNFGHTIPSLVKSSSLILLFFCFQLLQSLFVTPLVLGIAFVKIIVEVSNVCVQKVLLVKETVQVYCTSALPPWFSSLLLKLRRLHWLSSETFV